METILVLIGVGCIIGAIVGGGVKLVQIEVSPVSSLRRQILLGLFGAVLVLAGLVAGGHLLLPGEHDIVASSSGGNATAPDHAAGPPTRDEPQANSAAPQTVPPKKAATDYAKPSAPLCQQGYVWRDAFAGDAVCVTPDQRQQAAKDNAEANARRQPGGGAYGPDTCRMGYVWRNASEQDHVCVTPEQRGQTERDNALAPQRVAP